MVTSTGTSRCRWLKVATSRKTGVSNKGARLPGAGLHHTPDLESPGKSGGFLVRDLSRRLVSGVESGEPAHAPLSWSLLFVVYATARDARDCKRTYQGSTASMALMTSGASGSVRGRNRLTTSPSGATRNFSKF